MVAACRACEAWFFVRDLEWLEVNETPAAQYFPTFSRYQFCTNCVAKMKSGIGAAVES